MDVLLLLAGAALAFLASIYLQRRQRIVSCRAEIYLKLLPPVDLAATRYHQVADQSRGAQPHHQLLADEWPTMRDVDALYRQAVVAGRRDARHAGRIRERWIPATRRLYWEDGGTPTDQAIGDEKLAAAAAAVLEATREYNAWLEQKFRGRTTTVD